MKSTEDDHFSAWISPPAQKSRGLRIAVKDNIDLKGTISTAGCLAFERQAKQAPSDAGCLKGMRQAEARGELTIVGKTKLHELMYGASGVNDAYGTPQNPIDASRVPGGSSSGSAVAVARGECDIALGTDTGGSVRIPAACCGVIGLKTTWGAIPVDGVYPLAPSLDSVGPIAATLDNIDRAMQLLDEQYVAKAAPEASRIKVGLISNPTDHVDPWIQEAVAQALVDAGFVITNVQLYGIAETTAAKPTDMHGANDLIIEREALATNQWLLDLDDTNGEIDRGISPQMRTWLVRGAEVTNQDLSTARRTQQQWRDYTDSIFREFDVLASPTLAFTPPLIENEETLSLVRMTRAWNLSGHPAIALPIACTQSQIDATGSSMPASLQLIGPFNDEANLVAIARCVKLQTRSSY